jgi:hypothetical protein
MSGIRSFRNIQSNALVNELISYIEEQLPSFTTSDDFTEILSLTKNEDQHSEALCNFMTFQQHPLRFNFLREKSQKGNRTVDIGVYLKGGVLLFTLEAKVLPTPLTGERKEHEYVFGKGGGIQRFKDENHGVDNQGTLLRDNGMIAYVKEQNFDHWHVSINQWVLDATWAEGEKLRKISFSKIARLVSEHDRKGGSVVTLHHFWVVVN